MRELPEISKGVMGVVNPELMPITRHPESSSSSTEDTSGDVAGHGASPQRRIAWIVSAGNRQRIEEWNDAIGPRGGALGGIACDKARIAFEVLPALIAPK